MTGVVENPKGVKALPFTFPSDAALLLTLLGMAVIAGNLFVALVITVRANPNDAVQVVLAAAWNKAFVFVGAGMFVHAIRSWWRAGNTEPVNDRQIEDLVEHLRSELGVAASVEVLTNPNLGDRAVVGERPMSRRPYIALGPDLVELAGKRDDRSQRMLAAVIRHELGHLRNRDLIHYHLARTLRLAYMLGAAFYLLLIVIDGINGRLRTIDWWTLLKLVLIGLFVELLHRALLRAREHYADLRAGQVDGGDLRFALRCTGVIEGRVGRLSGLFRRHPLANERAELLDDPMFLARFPATYALAGGLLGGILIITYINIIGSSLSEMPGLARLAIAYAPEGLVLGPFLAIAIWRHSWAASISRRGSFLFAQAAALAVGYILGFFAAPIVGRPLRALFEDGAISLFVSLTMLIVKFLLLFLWLASISRLRHRVNPDATSSRAFVWLAMPFAVVGVAFFFATPAVGLGWLSSVALILVAVAPAVAAAVPLPTPLRKAAPVMDLVVLVGVPILLIFVGSEFWSGWVAER